MRVKTVVIESRHAGTSVVFCILDIMASVGRDWAVLHGGEVGSPVFDASLRSIDGAPYWDINGRKITPDAALHEDPQPDLIIVPDIHFDPHGELPDGLDPLVDWIAEAHARGATVTSVCSGAVLLGAAGLLNGMEATTHWGFADMLGRSFPKVRVCKEPILVPTGEGHRIVTAGRQQDDHLVAEAQIWAAQNYHLPSPVAAMAAYCKMTERGFHRRFKRATGQAPAEYVQTVRVEEAKQLLETTSMSIDEISEEVGYNEPSSFRSAFRKRVGISASAYRKKWSALAQAAL